MKFFEAMERYQSISGEISELEQAKTILETTPGPGMTLAVAVIGEAIEFRKELFDSFGNMEVVYPSEKTATAKRDCLDPQELPEEPSAECCPCPCGLELEVGGETNCDTCPEAEQAETVEMKLSGAYEVGG